MALATGNKWKTCFDKGPLKIGIHFKVAEEALLNHILSVKRT
jgi:hypothetical protein